MQFFTKSYEMRLDLRLKKNEVKREFTLLISSEESTMGYYKPPLPPLQTYHVVDASTGADLPYTIPPGYELEIIGYWHSVTQLSLTKIYIDGALSSIGYIEPNRWYYEHNIVETKSRDWDPDFSGSTLDVTITNLGSDNLEGYSCIYCILRDMTGKEW